MGWQNTSWQAYWPFLYCTELSYESEGVAASENCTKGTKIDYDMLQACYNGKDGDMAQLREAKQTVDHSGTPTTIINGKVFDNAVPLLQAICAAYSGLKPSGCNS